MKSVVLGGGRQAQGVPPVAPRLADLVSGVEDQEVGVLTGEVVSHRQRIEDLIDCVPTLA